MNAEFRVRVRLMVAEKIKERRKLSGLSQADIAGALGISASAYCRLEAAVNVPSVVQLAVIESVLEVPPGSLF